MLRAAKMNDWEGSKPEVGLSYEVNAHLSTGSVVVFVLDVPKRENCLTLRFPIDGAGDGDLYVISLEGNVPEQLTQTLSRLRHGNRVTR
jgi:hypothetical protein